MKKKSTYRSSSLALQKLAQRLQEGEAEAIDLIYRTYFHRLLYYGVQVAGSGHQQEVEDVIQEFFIWLVENSVKATQIQNLESYMFQSIRRNIGLRLNSAENSKAAYERYVNRTSPLLESTTSSPEQLYIQQAELESIKAFVQQELDQMPNYLREVLYLRYFEEKSYQEIATILSVSHQVAYNYVFRAMQKLKKQWGGLKILLLALHGIAGIFFD